MARTVACRASASTNRLRIMSSISVVRRWYKNVRASTHASDGPVGAYDTVRIGESGADVGDAGLDFRGSTHLRCFFGGSDGLDGLVVDIASDVWRSIGCVRRDKGRVRVDILAWGLRRRLTNYQRGMSGASVGIMR